MFLSMCFLVLLMCLLCAKFDHTLTAILLTVFCLVLSGQALMSGFLVCSLSSSPATVGWLLAITAYLHILDI